MSAIGQFYSLRGTVFLARYRLRQHRPSLDRAISDLQRSATRLPASHPDRPLVLAALSNGLMWRYERAADPGDLDRGIERLREAIASPGVPAAERAGFRGDLAALLRSRFLRSGGMPDLDEAIEAATDAVRHAKDPASAVTNRALALLARYEQTAHLGDLLGALRDARVPVDGPVRAALHRGLRLGVLTEALCTRYQYTDDPEDLAAAIAAGREALDTLSRVDPYRASYAAELSVVLGLSDDPAARDASVAMAEDALRDGSAAEVDHAYRLSTLSMALLMRHLATDRLDDLRRARELAEEALAGTATGHRNRPMLLQRIGLLARRWYDVTSDPAALERGDRAVREALSAVGVDDPVYGPLTCELAELLLRRPDGGAGAAAEARALLVATVRAQGPALTMHNSLRAATRLGELAAAAGDTQDALLGYRRAVELLPTAAWPGLRRAVREARLAGAPRATDAAAQAVHAGDPLLAVELLEAGRSVIWAQQLSMRSDLSRLRAAAPELADRMNEIRGWFERLAAKRVDQAGDR
jgi:tetratricopeptide (TPR) repeat protein